MMRLWARCKAILAPLTPEGVRRYGAEAAQWLEDPVLDRAIAQMRQAALDKWYAARESAQRELCWYELHRIDTFVGLLHKQITDAKVQDDRERRMERARASRLTTRAPKE